MANEGRRTEDALERILQEIVGEKKRARRWNNFFRLLFFIFLFVLFFSGPKLVEPTVYSRQHTAMLEIKGIIGVKGGVLAEDVQESLKKIAANQDKVRGLILKINSPGGSAAQAEAIYDAILRFKKEHANIPVYAVAEDLCASGGYYIAAAANKIYVSPASLVGSIGVIMSGFGFTGTMEKLGIERRLLTAGENKGFLDPFSPMNEAQKAHALNMLEQIHQRFIADVKKGRGERLKDDPTIFSGLIWTGEESIQLGLADEIGSAAKVARDVIGVEKEVDYTKHLSLPERLLETVSHTIAQEMLTLRVQ